MHVAPTNDKGPGEALETLLTAAEVAGLLRVHPSTISRMARRGQLRAVRLGRTLRIPVSAIRPPVIA